jgi:hypothetical protein
MRARGYLLQQGRFGADLVYFYREDSNLTAIFGRKSPDVPAGYGFDYINADGVIHELNVPDSTAHTPRVSAFHRRNLCVRGIEIPSDRGRSEPEPGRRRN